MHYLGNTQALLKYYLENAQAVLMHYVGIL